MRKNLWIILAVLVLALAVPNAQADTSVTVDLGQSAQNFVQTGGGVTDFVYAQWFIQNGSCAAGGGETTCTLSGNFTGSTPGFTGGTYALVTTYAGVGPTFTSPLGTSPTTPLDGISNGPFSGYFAFSYIPTGTTITLDLNESGGPNYVIPLWNGTTFVNGYSVAYTSASCSGTPSACDTYDVGSTPGAIIQGPVNGVATFGLSTVTTVPTGVPEPGSIVFLGSGLLSLLGFGRRKLLR